MLVDTNQLKLKISSTTSESLEYTLHYIYGNIKDPEFERVTILTINNLLTNSKTLLVGLELVKALVPYCSYNVIAENAVHWSNNCMVHYSEDPNKELKLNALAMILKNTSNMESFDKKFCAEYMNSTLKTCLNYHNTEEKVVGLNCLIQCMKKYPSWFGNHKQKMDQFLTDCLGNQFEKGIENAAFAFLCFLETGGGGVNGINYVNNFSLHFRKLCATVQSLYDSFFEDIPETNNPQRLTEEIFMFNQLAQDCDPNKKLEVEANRIINCLLFMKTMIMKRFSVEKQVVPKHVIDVISRGLNIHVCLSKTSVFVEKNNQYLLLNKIQLQLLKLFQIFVIRYQPHLLPFSHVLKNLLLNTLRRIHSCQCFVIDKSYRTFTYKSIITWLSLNKSVNESHFHEALIPLLLKDISPIKKNIVLNLDITNKRKMKPQQNSHLTNNSNSLESIDNGSLIKKSSCIYALDVLKCLLTANTVSANQTLQDVVNTIMKIVIDIQENRIVEPYTDISCQVKLYEVIISFFNQENIKCLPSIQLAVAVLNRGLNSLNWEISKISSVGLQLLEKISQPVCGTLYIPDLRPALDQEFSHNNLLHMNIEEENSMCVETDQENATNCEEHPNNDSNVTKKGIKIISDILINRSNDTDKSDIKSGESITEYDKEEEKELEIVSEDKVEEPLSKLGMEELDKPAQVNQIEASENKTEQSFSKRVLENESATLKKIEEVDVGNNLEDMFNSFQDVVQE
jgi:hypothetical protein